MADDYRSFICYFSLDLSRKEIRTYRVRTNESSVQLNGKLHAARRPYERKKRPSIGIRVERLNIIKTGQGKRNTKRKNQTDEYVGIEVVKRKKKE